MSGSWNTWTNGTSTNYITVSDPGAFITVTGGNPTYVYPVSQPETPKPREKKKMTEWVVEETSETGHKVRRKLTVDVAVDGNSSVMSEEETRKLVESATTLLGLRLIGKA
jgi:hypothetical protein